MKHTIPTQSAQLEQPTPNLSIGWQVGKVLFFFLLVLLSIYAVKALTTDIVLETQDAVFQEAYKNEIKSKEAMKLAIEAHEQSQITLCKAYTSLRAYKQLKNIKLANPKYNPCLEVAEKVERQEEASMPKQEQQNTKPLAQHNVTVTTYNPVKGQTDSSPCIGASGINQCVKAKEGVKMIAVSRDLRKFYPYKETIFLESDNPQIQGCYLVVDTMNARFTNRVDIFHMDKSKNTSGKGVISNKIENC